MGPIYTSSTAALRRAFDIFDADGNGSAAIGTSLVICVEIRILGAVASIALHAIDATPARWRGDAGSHRDSHSFLPSCTGSTCRPRDDEAAAEKALAQMFDMADIDHDGTVSSTSSAPCSTSTSARPPRRNRRATRRAPSRGTVISWRAYVDAAK